MATIAKKNGPALYHKLIQKFPLRPIRSDEELTDAIKVIDSLLDRDELDSAEQDYLDVLSDQVERYERDEHPMLPASDADLLRHLIEAKGVAQTEVASMTGIGDSTISEVLRGKRNLTRKQIGKMSQYFGINAAAFASE